MHVRDLDEVMHIAEGAFDPPWRRKSFEEELERSFAHCRVVREAPHGRVLGYAIWWSIAGEQQLLTIATAERARRRGIARALLSRMIEEGEVESVTACFLEVRVSNDPAIALYRSLGFEPDGTRARYYEDGEDALMMRRTVPPK
jgi:ribosomal-protein-alanine N-acetyltransferase